MENLKSNSNWIEVKGDVLPQQIQDWCDEKKVFEYSGSWFVAYFNSPTGNVEDAVDFMVGTDNAGFYKQDAEYMLWSNNFVMAYWSGYEFKKNLKRALKGNKVLRDTNYIT
jgi:hypothetical protein